MAGPDDRQIRRPGGILRERGWAPISWRAVHNPARLLVPILILVLLLSGCSVRKETSTQAGPATTSGAGSGAGLGSAATVTKDTVRITGATPIEDAAGVATAVFPGTSPPSRPRAITLVDSRDWRGAIAASVFAGQRTAAPVLLTDGGIPEPTRDAIDQLRPTGIDEIEKIQAIRIGGAPSPGGGLTTKVLTGPDPFATAAAIDRLNTQILGRPAGHVMIASGEHPEWAMPAAAWAARSNQPILYTGANAVPEATLSALRAHKQPHLYVLGPENVISAEVEKQLGKLAKDVVRIEGPTPVENAVAFARFARATFGWGFVNPGHNFTVASTTRPLDAAAAAALGSNGIYAPLLLVDKPNPLSLPVENYLLDVQPGYDGDPSTGVFNRVFILGDAKAVGADAQGRLDEITKLVPVTIENEAGKPPS